MAARRISRPSSRMKLRPSVSHEPFLCRRPRTGKRSTDGPVCARPPSAGRRRQPCTKSSKIAQERRPNARPCGNETVGMGRHCGDARSASPARSAPFPGSVAGGGRCIFCPQASEAGGAHENRRDRSARTGTPLWNSRRQRGRDPEKRPRNLRPGRAQEPARRPMEAQEVQGHASAQPWRVRGRHRQGPRRDARGRAQTAVILSRICRSSCRGPSDDDYDPLPLSSFDHRRCRLPANARSAGLKIGDAASYLRGNDGGARREVPMAIVLDHTIVPAHDKEASARFLARILGLRYDGALSHFAPLRVNDTLTLDFDNDTNFESHHYAFKVDEAEFDGIFDRVRAEGIAYGSGPGSLDDMKINHRRGGRGFYFRDPNGHVLEVLTA